jgi:hypothetical protein
MSKVAFITAILGNYDTMCQPFVKQTVDTDFICFTDDPNIKSNGWIIDTNPYWKTHPSKVDTGVYINSINKVPALTQNSVAQELQGNQHTFNLAKYYKQSWANIPRLAEYDVVIWIDGTIEIIASNVSEYMLELCAKYHIVSWHHEYRGGNLKWEVEASNLPRYHNNLHLGQFQPYQCVYRQYHDYIAQGYDESFWSRVERKEGRGRGDHFGMWLTCFVACSNKAERVKDFLDLWYLQTLKYSTQDQVGFPKVVQDTRLIPYTLPDKVLPGDEPHERCSAFIKHRHRDPTL